MITFNELKKLIAYIDWGKFRNNRLFLDRKRIDCFEVRPKENDVWFLNTKRDGYHVAKSWVNMTDKEKEKVIKYLNLIQ